MKKFETKFGGVKITFEVVDEDRFNDVVEKMSEWEDWDYSTAIHLREEAQEGFDEGILEVVEDNFSALEAIVKDMAWNEYLKNVLDDFDAGRRKNDIEGFQKKIMMEKEYNEMMGLE